MAPANQGFHTMLLHMTVWLLQRGFLRQLHEYVLLLVPTPEMAPVDLWHRRWDGNSPSPSPRQTLPGYSTRPPEAASVAAASRLGGSHVRVQAPRESLGVALAAAGAGAAAGAFAAAAAAAAAAAGSGGLLPHEEAYLREVDDGSRLFDLFRRLCPLFRGQRHLRGIVWAERLDSWEVAEVLKTYRAVLVSSLRP
ncbi:unnamed protein product [Phaeothamnion confervicola]